MVVAVGVGGGGGERGRRGVHLAARAATYTLLVLPPIGRTLVSPVRGLFLCVRSRHCTFLTEILYKYLPLKSLG